MKITLIGLAGFFLSPAGFLAQDVSILTPKLGETITPGQPLQVVLKTQSTTSSVEHIAFSAGFRTTSTKDETSLGRPYVGSFSAQPPSTNVKHDATQGTYSFEIHVPKSNQFPDGFSAAYELVVSHYYLLGATFTPTVKMTSVKVNVQDNHS